MVGWSTHGKSFHDWPTMEVDIQELHGDVLWWWAPSKSYDKLVGGRFFKVEKFKIIESFK